MFESFLTYLLCVTLACWYLRDPNESIIPRIVEANLKTAVDEWNARELVGEESETFYE